MRLDWLYQGPNAGFLIAQEKGFYEQAGLSVEIGPGKGSGSTAQLVASKAAQFGFATDSSSETACPRVWASRWLPESSGATQPRS
jgi:ABC-type nitrate/sulfonate/bicarbonate transport system substrate-binding protein